MPFRTPRTGRTQGPVPIENSGSACAYQNFCNKLTALRSQLRTQCRLVYFDREWACPGTGLPVVPQSLLCAVVAPDIEPAAPSYDMDASFML